MHAFVTIGVVASLGLSVGLGVTAARAASPSDTLIEARQAGMDLVAANFDLLRIGIPAKAKAETLQDSAEAMGRWGRLMPSLYVAGTETGHDTKAKPAAFSDSAGFSKAALAFADASDQLAAKIKAGDMDGAAAALKPVGAACGACHRAYKER